ncbi:DUF2398 family protein [Exiguobacterium sp. SL14]|nr:DUF2398 family protein [Exiguobacterium sp. SL14]MCY1690059.1 DUF2398 family protein [Exiguobacterium sp. SL14]
MRHFSFSGSKTTLYLVPDKKGISTVALHVATCLRQEIPVPDEMGRIRMTLFEFHALIEQTKQTYEAKWSKQYRESTARAIAKELIPLLRNWELIEVEEESEMIVLHSGFGRMIGA